MTTLHSDAPLRENPSGVENLFNGKRCCWHCYIRYLKIEENDDIYTALILIPLHNIFGTAAQSNEKAILLFEIGNLNTFNMIFDSAGHTQSSHEHPAQFKQYLLLLQHS